MFDALQQAATVYTSPPYPTFSVHPKPAAGQCALRECAEQFGGGSPGFLDNGGISGNLIAVGNAGKPCSMTRTCDNFGHCQTRAVCSVLSAGCAGRATL
jgi:hypothetical protein